MWYNFGQRFVCRAIEHTFPSDCCRAGHQRGGFYQVSVAILTIMGLASVLLSLSPTSANVPMDGTQVFTASVTGTSNAAVSWVLSGEGCSGSACGTLSTSLLSAVYLGPINAPSPGTVSVLVTSIADPTKSTTAEVTIMPTAYCQCGSRKRLYYLWYPRNNSLRQSEEHQIQP